jgi:thiol-disulfide isomerase/thioredoxin
VPHDRPIDRAQPVAEVSASSPRSSACPVRRQAVLSRAPEVIAPDERVPDFFLATEGCEIIDSRELVGKEPFVVVFFASWCSVCEHKMPAIQRAVAARNREIRALFVSLDDADGWDATREFLSRHGLSPGSAVAGRDFVGFSLGYNPFRSVPVVVVVGRSGRVVDVQIGVRRGDDGRLIKALDLAIEEPPEQLRLTSYPRP